MSQEAGPAPISPLVPISTENIAQRLYDWCFLDAERELREGFPFVTRIKGGNAARYLGFFSQLPPADASLVSRVLVKRMNQPVLLRLKPALTQPEEKYLQAYLQFGEVSGPGGIRMVVGDPEERRAVQTRELRKALKGLVKERFRPEFGVPMGVSANEWHYEVDAGCLRVRTHVDVGGRSSLSYSHAVLQEDGTPLPSHLSVLQWLGAASMTRWRVLLAEELIDAADTVFLLSKHFVAEMRRLFA